MVLLHDSVHSGKSQPGSLPCLLSGKEGLENPGGGLFFYSHTRVGHRHYGIFTGNSISVDPYKLSVNHGPVRAYGERAALGHGVPRVSDKIHQYLLYLPTVRLDDKIVFIENELQVNFFP